MKKKFLLILIFLIGIFFKISASLLCITGKNRDAVRYVGNLNPENGKMQLNLLLLEGLKKKDYVLEIGCGALIAGIPIMSFLDSGCYVGIDPNKWLIDDSLKIEENKKIVDYKQPLFLYNYNFDASETKIVFDYIIAHSVMSHAPLWQLKLFLKNCSKILKDSGKVIFSLRLTANDFYNGKEESTTNQWQYPGNTFFHEKTVFAEASKWFKKVEYKKLYTKLILFTDKGAIHDWFVLTK